MDNAKNSARMAVGRNIRDGVDAIVISGPFDIISEACIDFAKEIIKEGKKIIILDLTDAAYLTSQGIACIIKMTKQIQAAECSLRIRNANADMIDLIRLASIDKYVTFI